MSVLITRPEADSQRFAARLAEDGIESLIWPLTRIEFVCDSHNVPDDADLVLFTSRHAVATIKAPARLRAICVGRATAEAAIESGFDAMTATGGTAADVAEVAKAAGASHVFYPRAENVSTDLAANLNQVGIKTTEQIVYRAATAGPAPQSVATALLDGTVYGVTVWSARNAALLIDQIVENPGWLLDQADLVAISENAAQPVMSRHQETRFSRILVAEQPNAESMLRTVSAALRQKTRSR